MSQRATRFPLLIHRLSRFIAPESEIVRISRFGDSCCFLGFLDSVGDGNGGVLEGIGPTGTVTTIVVGAVPEPETGAMLLAGLGAMAMVMRRRRRR
ncbi:PEP-CTERM sorting domain-containing protein [Xylophilus rhododendri]|uniref:PEP-CTERM sorting domain-containing protein n=1 Tax=Xylophilus rhododendri TaxID=2697032 RepID=A0A857JD65_9BURK|nr:PEP-CTERM sorting domain-containing protein [Xylophilus rhododendri]